jgi:protocatechuate 3,4-dioxygenase beta subunit
MTGPIPLQRRDRGAHPPALAPGYRSTVLRAPSRPPLSIAPSIVDLAAVVLPDSPPGSADRDLIGNFGPGEAIGERIVVHGRVNDANGAPIPGALLEVWQANAGGRYRHAGDAYRAPLDPNFGGSGWCTTDAEGRYWFRTILPGPYPWRNDGSNWRPAHIHFSIFGRAFAQRLVTQMYFEGDPLIPLCPLVGTLRDAAAADRLVARLDIENQGPFDHLTYRFDIVLRGARATFLENAPEAN